MFSTKMMRLRWCALIFVVAAAAHAYADAAFLLEEPYGAFGSMNPTGHAAVYLSRVCAASPTQLRRCEPGEAGVVISRYHRVAGYDWIAIPLLPYLYAVDTLPEIPKSADAQSVAALRDEYRRAHLTALAPDTTDDGTPKGDWTQLVGSAYDRTLYGFQIETTPEQDDALIQYFNNGLNRTRYSLFRNNCADFAREVMNFYVPHAVHRNFFADAGITTPKQVARSLARYARHHPIVELSSFQIQQVAGSIHRSHSADGVAEALLKTKKYVVPLAILSPAVTGSIAVVYFTEGRFNPKRDASMFDVSRVLQPQPSRTAATVPVDSPALPGVASEEPKSPNP
jgi:hypothetical protein